RNQPKSQAGPRTSLGYRNPPLPAICTKSVSELQLLPKSKPYGLFCTIPRGFDDPTRVRGNRPVHRRVTSTTRKRHAIISTACLHTPRLPSPRGIVPNKPYSLDFRRIMFRFS